MPPSNSPPPGVSGDAYTSALWVALVSDEAIARERNKAEKTEHAAGKTLLRFNEARR